MLQSLKLRIDPPNKFNGKDYDEFAKNMRNYMSLSSLRYAALLERAATSPDPITDDLMEEQYVDEQEG